MKYILLLLIGVTLTGCVPMGRPEEDPVLYRETNTTVTETLVYKNHMIQRQTVTVDQPIHEVQVQPLKKEDTNSGESEHTEPPKSHKNADGSHTANESITQ